jgi:hypothetical protein
MLLKGLRKSGPRNYVTAESFNIVETGGGQQAFLSAAVVVANEFAYCIIAR